jgi:hypothetical protein
VIDHRQLAAIELKDLDRPLPARNGDGKASHRNRQNPGTHDQL